MKQRSRPSTCQPLQPLPALLAGRHWLGAVMLGAHRRCGHASSCTKTVLNLLAGTWSRQLQGGGSAGTAAAACCILRFTTALRPLDQPTPRHPSTCLFISFSCVLFSPWNPAVFSRACTSSSFSGSCPGSSTWWWGQKQGVAGANKVWRRAKCRGGEWAHAQVACVDSFRGNEAALKA